MPLVPCAAAGDARPDRERLVTTVTTETTDTLATLAARLADVQDRKSVIENEEKAIKSAILALTDGPDRYAAGPLTVLVSQARTLDKAAVAAKYPAADHPELYETTVSVKKVREHVAPVDLEPFETVSAPSVRLL